MPSMGSLVDWTWLKKSICKLGNITIETSITGKRKKDREKNPRISTNSGTTIKVVTYTKWEYQQEETEKGNGAKFEAIMTENFPNRCQIPKYRLRKLREYQGG